VTGVNECAPEAAQSTPWPVRYGPGVGHDPTPVSVNSRVSAIKLRMGWLAFLALVLRVIPLARSDLLTEQRAHRGVSIDGDFLELGVGRFLHPLSHAPLVLLQLPRYAKMQRGQETPESSSWRQLSHFENAGQIGSYFRKQNLFKRDSPT
jgi:hypothetical protein